VDRIFYEFFKAFPFDPPFLKQCALVDENGERRPAYYGLKALIEKLDRFTSAENLAEGQYRFVVEGKTIYVLWGSDEIPKEIIGEVLVTDIYGQETRNHFMIRPTIGRIVKLNPISRRLIDIITITKVLFNKLNIY